MQVNFTVFFNLFIPIITGLFFLLYFAYFIFSNPSKAASYRYFIAFLLSFGVFLMGRALQVSAGPYPLPLIIVNVRVFILCAVVSPVTVMTSNVFRRKGVRRRELLLICGCVALGVVYVVFNTLGTRGSYVLYGGDGLIIYDNLTPSLRPPFYAREVTLAVQVVVGALLLLFSLDKLIAQRRDGGTGGAHRDKNVLVNAGIAIFALSFITGSLARQWWIYYAASIVSALFIGASVLADIKEVRSNYEKLVPFIKEDIVHDFALKDFPKARIREMLRMLGKDTGMDTFALMRIQGGPGGVTDGLAMLDAALDAVHRKLREAFEEEAFLVLPISNDRIGIMLSLLGGDGGRKSGSLETLEETRAEVAQKAGRAVKVGIGRSYRGLDDLRSSYGEALNALEYAERLEGSDVIHADNISESGERESRYPVREKERLLSAIKSGGAVEAKDALSAFMQRFTPFVEGNPGIMRARLYELAGSIMDAAVLGGGDEKKLGELAGRRFDDIDIIRDPEDVSVWLGGLVGEAVGSIGRVVERRSKTMIQNAKRFINENFFSQIGYKDVAKEIFISPSYFLNLFKRETGLTFTDYLTNVRIGRAKELLKSTEKTITDIAFEVGFNNSNYFSNTFKKAAGVSAKEYRNSR